MTIAYDLLKVFSKKGETIFRPPLEKYGYKLIEKLPIEFNGNLWSIHHIYMNEAVGLKILVKQEPCYSDYGFSIFIHKLLNNEFNILYNVPKEEQDHEDNFLIRACNDILLSSELIDIIAGKAWTRLGYIPFINKNDGPHIND